MGAGGHHLHADALRQNAVHQSLEGGVEVLSVEIVIHINTTDHIIVAE